MALINKETEKLFIEKSGVSIHTLRHSYASIAAEMGYSELTIAGLLGHSLGSVTNRYSHLPDPSLINAADKVSLCIEQALSGKKEPENNVIELKRG
jgi:site-specific recombinase XerD